MSVSPPDARINSLIGHYLKIADKIDALDAQYKKMLAPLTQLREEISDRLRALLNANGIEKAQTDLGSVRIEIRHSASCREDPEGFLSFVIEQERWELMERRACTVPCLEYAEEHGNLPPGITINTIRNIKVTGSKS